MLVLVFLLRFSLMFIIVVALQPVPSNKKIEIIEGQKYNVGFEENDKDTNITKCAYVTDTGIKKEFTENDRRLLDTSLPIKSVDNNKISHSLYTKACTITIENVDDTSPRKWDLTVYTRTRTVNNKTEDHSSSATITVDFFYKVSILKEKFSVIEGESVYQYLNTSDITFKSCKLKHGNSTTILNIQTSENVNDKGSPLSLGYGLCGFKIYEVTKENDGKWTLDAIGEDNKPYRSIFSINVYSKPDPKEVYTKQSVILGESVYISCGSKYNQEYCFLYDPYGNFVYTSEKDCSYRIGTLTVKDLGNWTCSTSKSQVMQPIDYTVELESRPAKKIVMWINETKTNYNIGCRILNTDNKNVNLCKIIAPNQLTFVPRLGFATGRYMSFGTNYTDGTCAIEIPKPLLDYENGLWRCEIISALTHMGRFIEVGNIKQSTYKRHIQITKQLGDRLSILCEVDFSSPYCHIRDPNGTLHVTNNQQSTFGRCLLDIREADASHNGTWTCSFAREAGMPDEEIYVEVRIAEVLLLVTNTQVDSGSFAPLICTTGGLPLQYCRFVSPLGIGYHVTNDLNTSSMIYYGRGLEYGECGIRLLNAQLADNGHWTCFTRIHKNELSARIQLTVNPGMLEDPNVVMAVSVSVGVVVVTILVGMIGYRIWRRRRNHDQLEGVSLARGSQRRADPDASSENVDIFSLVPTPRSYTNPQAVIDYDDHEHQL